MGFNIYLLVQIMIYIVLGAQFGDEGKGKQISYLTQKANICVRFNGGSNAGHTIVVGTQKYYTHLIPSGIVSPDIECVLGNGMVINMVALFREMNELIAGGLELSGRILISNKAHITLLIHCLVDSFEGKKIGTTNQGVGPTYTSKSARYGLRFDDLSSNNWFEKLTDIYNRYTSEELSEFVKKNGLTIKSPEGREIKFTSINDMMYYDIGLISSNIEFLKDVTIDCAQYLHHNLDKNILIEGANAAMLDIDFGTYPFVTSSSCTIGGVLTGTGLNPSIFGKNTEIIGITTSWWWIFTNRRYNRCRQINSRNRW